MSSTTDKKALICDALKTLAASSEESKNDFFSNDSGEDYFAPDSFSQFFGAEISEEELEKAIESLQAEIKKSGKSNKKNPPSEDDSDDSLTSSSDEEGVMHKVKKMLNFN
ncbi:13899_t:CDS:1 [Acaulospora morrowiae]|uniref:13899_t:CDS:1 n=1 Tax=Acaulospora morrowiae TaxID=94023 RepID=A0A9N9E671_9GLOM|nr:13899_t:CDS:1 [Acaulospora morrowiae]